MIFNVERGNGAIEAVEAGSFDVESGDLRLWAGHRPGSGIIQSGLVAVYAPGSWCSVRGSESPMDAVHGERVKALMDLEAALNQRELLIQAREDEFAKAKAA